MKRSIAGYTKGIWSEKENSVLAQLVLNSKKKTWKEIAKSLNAKCGKEKTAKQCRERYRNYVNPKICKSAWRPLEKLLFTILHQIYGNCWKDITLYLKERSDVAIKNYFYHIIRKITKQVSKADIDTSLLQSPEKFYRHYSVLMYIKKYYLPNLKNVDTLPKYCRKDHTVLKILSNRKIAEESIKNYQERMLTSFKLTFISTHLPIEIKLPLEFFSVPSEKAKQLKDLQSTYNVFPLSEVIRIRIQENNEELKNDLSTPINNPKPSLNIFEYTSSFINPYNFTTCGHLLQPLGNVRMIPQIIHCQNNFFPQIAHTAHRITLGPVMDMQMTMKGKSLNRERWYGERRDED